MRMRLPGFAPLSFACCSLAGLILAPSAFAQGQATPAKPEAPRASASNQEKMSTVKPPKTDSLKVLEDTLFKPLQNSLDPDKSLDPPLPQAPRANTPAQNKKLRNAIDRKKNWVFMTPEEMLNSQNPNELLGEDAKDNEEKEMTPMQRYMYRRLYPSKDSSKANSSDAKRDPWEPKKDSLRDRLDGSADRNDSENPEEGKEGVGKKDSDKASRKPDEPKNRNASIFSDIFGISRPETTKEEERAEKMRLDAFKQSLGLPVAPSFDAKSFSPFATLPEPSPAAVLPPATIDTSSTSPKSSGFAPQLGTIPTLPSLPTVTPASTPQPFGGPSLAPSLPVSGPSRTLPPQPTFTAPRRSF